VKLHAQVLKVRLALQHFLIDRVIARKAALVHAFAKPAHEPQAAADGSRSFSAWSRVKSLLVIPAPVSWNRP
jgi:hypothetical protein